MIRHAMPVLVLLSGSLSAQSVSDTIIQRERAKLQAEHTGEGFGAMYLPTYEGVNQGGQVRALGPGSLTRPPPIRSSFWKNRSRCRCISPPPS